MNVKCPNQAVFCCCTDGNGGKNRRPRNQNLRRGDPDLKNKWASSLTIQIGPKLRTSSNQTTQQPPKINEGRCPMALKARSDGRGPTLVVIVDGCAGKTLG